MRKTHSPVRHMITGLLTAALLLLSATVTTSGTPATAATAPSPMKSDSIHGSMTTAGEWAYNYTPYGYWASPTASYLTTDEDGNLTRIEANEENGKVRIETYSPSDHQIRKAKTLDMHVPMDDYSGQTYDKPLFGGVYLGNTYNYIFLGQKNESQKDTCQVIRIVQYDKKWEVKNAFNLRQIKTTVPFKHGSLRCAEYGDMLYVYTCHEMYKSTDGYNHQANLRFTFNQKTGVPTGVLFDVSEEKNGYCSHSFNQFIDIQGTDVYTLDHGDASPRGIFLSKYEKKAGENLNNPTTVQTVLSFPGDIGDKTTKTSLGGFAVSDTTCLIPYNQGGNSSQRSIYLGTIGKDEVGTGTLKITTLDTPDADSTYGVPMLTRLSDGRYLIRWQVFSKDGDLVKKARYAIVDGTGSIVSSVKTIEAYLSDCQPHVSEDGIVSWYTTGTKSESDTVPTFYHLNTATDEFTSAKAFVLPTLKTPVLKSINKKTGVLKGTGTKGATIHILFAGREFLVNCNKKKAYTLKLRKFYKKKLKKGATIKIYATMDGYNDSKTKTYKVP